MEDQITNYQCPSCTAPLRFDAKKGLVVCDYCDSEYTIEALEELIQEKEKKEEAKKNPSERKEAEKAKEKALKQEEDNQEIPLEQSTERLSDGYCAYSCQSCGAEVICEETTVATACPYCGNPVVASKKVCDDLKPDMMIPFKVTKEEAMEALKKHYNKRFFLPKVFKSENHLEEIKGVYVPFWLYTTKVDADAAYDCTNVTTTRHGDYLITRTSHYDVTRQGTYSFEKVPVDGSKKMPNDYMDSIEPYHYDELVPFSKAYLPGFLADRYDEDAETCKKRMKSRVMQSAKEMLRDSIGVYTNVHKKHEQIRLDSVSVSYALLPVWVLTTKWKEKQYLFMMNGQTGRLVGDLPMDYKKYWLTFGLITAGVFLAMTLGGLGTAIAALFA